MSEGVGIAMDIEKLNKGIIIFIIISQVLEECLRELLKQFKFRDFSHFG